MHGGVRFVYSPAALPMSRGHRGCADHQQVLVPETLPDHPAHPRRPVAVPPTGRIRRSPTLLAESGQSGRVLTSPDGAAVGVRLPDAD